MKQVGTPDETTSAWRTSEVVAWTDHDGPGRPPGSGGRWLWMSAAVALGAAFAVVLSGDTLCPEHRTWVVWLAGLALVGAGSSLVGLVRGAAGAPLLTVLSALLGVGIGLIDAVHDPVRGGLIAAAFGAAALIGAALALRSLHLLRWDRRLHRSLARRESPAVAPAPTSGAERRRPSAASVDPDPIDLSP